MPVFTVPLDYDETIDHSTVPICVSAVDDAGNPVHFEWIQHGVAPIADKLVRLADGLLQDRWRASEITEPVVHQLSRDFGPELGVDPSARVLSGARWYAYDLRAGGRRARRRTEVELFSNTLESLEDQVDLARSLMAKNMLDRLVGQLTELGMHEVREMVPMMLRECEPEQFQQGSTSHETRSRNSFRSLGSDRECCLLDR